MSWLLSEGRVLAAAETAPTRRARRRGLLGRTSYEGAFVLQPCRHVHTLGMRFAIDVACCDKAGTVLRTFTLAPWRLAPIVRHTAFVIEAEAGAFERWGLRAGAVVEVRK